MTSLPTTFNVMTTNTSYTAVATSEIGRKLSEALEKAQQSTPAERIERIRRVQEKIDDFSRRGLLKRQSYLPAASPADFRRLYLTKQPARRGD